jgi:hypothetical protein
MQKKQCPSWRGKATVRPRRQGRGVGVHRSKAESLYGRSGRIQAQGLARKGREGRCRFANLEGSRVLGEIGNCNLLGWRKYEKTLDLERIGKLAPEFFIAAQLLQFPLEAGKQEVALRIGHLFERFGGIHHKRGTGVVGSTERPGWE